MSLIIKAIIFSASLATLAGGFLKARRKEKKEKLHYGPWVEYTEYTRNGKHTP